MPRAKRYKHNGKELTIREWATETGLSAGTIQDRIHKMGWDIERAVTTPSNTVENKTHLTTSRKLKEGFIELAYQAFQSNEEVCLSALNEAFKADPLKTMKELAQFLPKDIGEHHSQQKALVRIELAPPPQIIMEGK